MRDVSPQMIRGFSFAGVRRPVDCEAGQTTLAEMFNEVFGGETRNSGDCGKVVCIWFLELVKVPAEAQLIMDRQLE
jgi:hypothetical protein